MKKSAVEGHRRALCMQKIWMPCMRVSPVWWGLWLGVPVEMCGFCGVCLVGVGVVFYFPRQPSNKKVNSSEANLQTRSPPPFPTSTPKIHFIFSLICNALLRLFTCSSILVYHFCLHVVHFYSTWMMSCMQFEKIEG